MSKPIVFNKYLPVALLYFFFNSVLLPFGLLYTTILTPVFIIWLYGSPSFKYIWYFFPVMAVFAAFHFSNGVVVEYYVRSTLLLFSVYVFCISFYEFLRRNTSLRNIYKNILLVNSILVLVALVALFIPKLTFTFWYNNEITSGFSRIKRLQLLTYEPSYYSTLLVPLAMYYYNKILLRQLPNPYLLLFLVSVPLILSLSFGVILGIILALFGMTLMNFKLFFPNRNLFFIIIGSGITLLVALAIFINLYPENVFVVRISNVFSGRDTSFNGRTFDSFYLGWQIAGEKSLLFGCGPGQVKVVGLDNFKVFYNYEKFTVSDIGIPNSLGDTLATFGLVGIGARLFAEVYLFFKTRVWTNYYRLSIFLFIFIYQFTGSFLTNIAEYVLWILAFFPALFEELDKRKPVLINSYSKSQK